MRKVLFFSAIFIFNISFSQVINTVAGNGLAGYLGDGGQATAARLNVPTGVLTDASGNMYITDYANHVIRKVTPAGIITTIAGNGNAGFSGDGGQATAAELQFPQRVAFDAAGNMYIADGGNARVRKVNPSGVISTIAGNGTPAYSGDGGQATAAELDQPSGVALDASGNLYIADFGNMRIRMVTPGGIISTFAGKGISGFSGDGGPATAAEFANPQSVTFDASGNLYVGDFLNYRVRKISGGIVSTIAGNGTAAYSGDGGQATAAELNFPEGVAVDGSGNIYIADQHNARIRVVNSSGIINTFAGNGTAAYSGDGGQATAAEIKLPTDVGLDVAGNVYISDEGNNRIRFVKTAVGVTASVTANVSCNGGSDGSASATASGGKTPYTYTWSPVGGNNSNATGLSAGSYTITVQDANAVTCTASVTITQPAAVLADGTPTLNSNVPCFGGVGSATTATPTGGTSPYTYAWNGGATSTNATNVGLSAGTYTVNVTDAHGCTVNSSGTVTITQPAAALADGTPTLNSNVPCFGGVGSATAATPTGGTSPYTYAWNGGATSTNATNAGLSAGTYTVNVTDAHGCTVNSSGTVTITQPAAALADGTPILNSNVPCFGGVGSATAATPTGGTSPYTYAWNGGATSTNATNAGLSAGTYTVNVTDAHGCTVNSSGTVTITQPAVLTVSTGSIVNILCHGGNNGKVTATPGGGTSPYTYLWSDANSQTAPTATGLTAGSYTVTVHDAHGCSATASANITQPNLLTDSISSQTNVTCFGGNNGFLKAGAKGGTPVYTYSWSPGGETTNTITGISAGCYTVTVTDANGCTATASSCITQPNPLSASATANPDTICAGGCSMLTVTANGNTPPYNYRWSNGATSSSINVCPASSTTYSVSVIDPTCSDSILIMVKVNVQICAGIPGISSSDDRVKIYPNPNNGSFQLGISNYQLGINAAVEIYSMIGEKVYSKTFSIQNSTFKIDMKSQPAGLYLYRVITSSDGLVSEGKFIIQK